MKRLFILAAVILSSGVSLFASDYDVLDKLNDKTRFDGVVRYLGADSQQKKDLQLIFNESTKKYKKETDKGLAPSEASQKAVYFNLANVRAVLSPEQYRKYVMILNVTLNNSERDGFFAEN